MLVVRAARPVGDTVPCGEAHREAHLETDLKVPHA